MTTDNSNTVEITAPSWLLALLEAPRALTEASSLIPAHSLLKSLAAGDGHAVMTLPGFLASDRSTRTLRRYMRNWGYDAHRWEQGRNLGPSRTHDVEGILDARLEDIFQQSGGKVTLVGWSLGGLFAREMARRNPQLVRSVITLGSPLGNPRATNAWRLYELVSGIKIDDEMIRQRVEKLRAPTIDVPITAIYSKTDAVVAWQIAKLPPGDRVENIGIATSHLGMGFNPAVLYAIADRLRQADEDWRPFEISGFRNIFYH
ncbi:MAG: alpha/beta hydrolase [Gammaproteobacteria bacterium]|nr:MAG: alpha/beta hydrolase [Gammaproteobacteria bacterium]RLA31022.1 MAG: alpha/beta hydrolase [Gammaproteobacteria bacterium]